MAKQTTSTSKNNSKSKNPSSHHQDGNLTRTFVPDAMLWPIVTACFSALLVLSFLIPADSIAVYQGGSLPGVLGWMLVAMSAVAAGFITNLRVRASRLEITCVLLGLTWLVVENILVSQGSNRRALWNGFWQLMAIASCYYVARGLMQVEKVRSATLLLLIVGCSSLAFDGLWQVMITMPASRAAYQKDPERILKEHGIDAPAGSPKRRVFEDRLNSPEPFATFSLANSLGTMLCLGAILTIQVLTQTIVLLRTEQPNRASGTSRAAKTYQRSRFVVAAISIALLAQLSCLLLTRSRTAYLAFGIAVCLWGLLEIMRGGQKKFGRSVLSIVGVGIVLAVTGVVGMIAVDKRIATEAIKSLGYRIEYWQATLAMIKDHALIGIGLGNFQSIYPRYKLIEASETIADPHNWVLDIAVTLSLPIAIGIVAWVLFTLVRAVQVCLQRSDSSAAIQVDQLYSDQLVRWMFVGAFVGGGFCAALSILAGQISWTTLAAWAISIPLGYFVWKSNVLQLNSLSNQLAACIGVLICLLFSGGWQCPGIAMPLVLMLAMLNVACRSIGASSEWNGEVIDGSRPSNLSNPRWALTMVLLTLGGGIIFVVQTWRPVTQSWRWTEELQNAISAQEQLRLATEAANADTVDPVKQIMLAQLETSLAAPSGPSEFATLANAAIKRFQAIRDNNHATYQVAGNACLELAAGAKRLGLDSEDFVKKASEFYSQAAARYPSSIELQMQCAAVAALQKDWGEVENRLNKSEELDRLIPHLDKKLGFQLVWLPVPIPDFDYTASGQEQNGFVRAEPLAAWLRSKLEAK